MIQYATVRSSVQRQLLARLGQGRITNLPLRTTPCRSESPSLLQFPAPFRIEYSGRGFSTSRRLGQEQQSSQTNPTPTSTTLPPLPPPPPPSQPKPRRRRPRWYGATVFLLIGVITGTAVRAIISPPPPLLPDSKADQSLRRDIQNRAQSLPIVQHLLASPEWNSSSSSFPHHDAYASIPEDQRATRITTGPLGGTSGVGGYQHIFHNHVTGEVVAVLYFGTSTIGWPGVVHGGLIATILNEHAARAAMQDPALSESRRGVLTARLELQYRKPTLANDFYVVRARATPEAALDDQEKGKRDRKMWVDARLETVGGHTCVEGKALFVIPKGTELRGIGENF